MKKWILISLLVLPVLAMAQVRNVADNVLYKWTFEPDSTALAELDLTVDGYHANVFGYTKWWWEIDQIVAGDHGGTADDSVQFSLWGYKLGLWDSLVSFPPELDSATVGTSVWPKHHSLDIGVDADTLWVYDRVRIQARYFIVDTGFGNGGTSPKYLIELRLQK